MNDKEILEKAILGNNGEEIYRVIQQYEKKYPRDFDLYSYYCLYYLSIEEFGMAYDKAKEAVEKNPFHLEANYNFAICAEKCGDLANAYDYYMRTFFLQDKYGQNVVGMDELNTYINEIIKAADFDKQLKRAINYINVKHGYAIRDPFRNYGQDVVGVAIADTNNKEYYAGRASGWFEAYFEHGYNKDSFTAKCELFPIEKCASILEVEAENEKVLVPVCLNYNTEDKEINFIADTRFSNDDIYAESAYCKYSYLPIDGNAKLVAAKPAIFGKPIPLTGKDKNKKSLVLNIFVDSFNAKVIKQYGLENIMPNTYRYFSKGVKCENYYSCSEYTLPSIATYWTGLYPSNHMNLENSFRVDFMRDKKVFPEYFKEAGYVTAKIGGNDAITPAQGYIRGIDRFLYQINSEGLTVKEVVSDALEHIETFKETNQFVWLDIVDLHHVAGGFMRSLGVQSGVDLKSRCIDNQIKTTVQQSRSLNREKIYIQELKQIDFYLGLLYQYIENNYTDSEVIVSLFSDHGTAFMVDDNQPFLSEQRTNVPLMIRAEGIKTGICDEIIEATDYAGIICNLAGLEYDYVGKDANLPVWFGGGKEKECAISQSFFMGDPYQVGIHEKNRHFYFKTEKNVDTGFRINLEGSRIWELGKYQDTILELISHLVQYTS